MIQGWRHQYNIGPFVFFRADSSSPFLKSGFSEDLIRIQYNGLVSASQTGVFGVVCNFDAQWFPFDQQECHVLLQIGIYTSTEVGLAFSNYGAQYTGGEMVDHPIWKMDSLKYISVVSPVEYFIKQDVSSLAAASSYSLLSIGFTMTRRSLYYTCTMIVPSALLSILTLGAFFIPNDSGEKISCGLSIFLSFVVFLIQIGDIVPENSTAISVIGKCSGYMNIDFQYLCNWAGTFLSPTFIPSFFLVKPLNYYCEVFINVLQYI